MRRLRREPGRGWWERRNRARSLRSRVRPTLVGWTLVAGALGAVALVAFASQSPSPSPSSPPATLTRPSETPPPRSSPEPVAVSAFPSAVGYGKGTIGGRGGSVFRVTTLAESGPGSLREAIEAPGPRTIVFAVAGTIELNDDIDVAEPYVTIAGQTAPGDGVQIRGGMLRVVTHDVLIRYMRLRPGDERTDHPADLDAITLSALAGREVWNVVIDHSTMLWGPDIGGIAILGNAHDITVSDSIIGEGLYVSRHPEGKRRLGGHAFGTNIAEQDTTGWPARITYLRNLIATADERVPRVMGAECVDVVNTVIYNWGNRGPAGSPRALNIVANLFRAGPEIVSTSLWRPSTSDDVPSLFPDAVYEAGSVADGFNASRDGPDAVYADSVRCGRLSVEAADPRAAYEAILAGAGATLPVRDPVDERIVANVRARTGRFLNGQRGPEPRPDWPELASGVVPADDDLDGMPDAWERRQLGSTEPDGTGDLDGDGYTDLEEFLNGSEP